MENDRLRPSNPAKVMATQSIPGATIAIILGVGSNAKLKITMETSAKVSTAVMTFLVRSSNKMSFQATAKIVAKKMFKATNPCTCERFLEAR